MIIMIRKNNFCPFYIISFIGKPLSGESAGDRGIIGGAGKVHISIKNSGNPFLRKKGCEVHLMEKYISIKDGAVSIGIYSHLAGKLLSVHCS